LSLQNGQTTDSASKELPVSAYSWIIALLLLLSYAVSFVDRNTWSTAIPLAAPALKITMTAAGGLMTAFYIGYVASNFVSGYFVDRFGPRLTLGVGVLITSVFTLLFPFATSYSMLFALRVAAGIGSGPLFASGVKFQLGWFPKSSRATAMGMMMTGPAVGAAIASGLLAPVMRSTGWRNGFTWAGIMTLVIAVAVLFLAKERGMAVASGPKKVPSGAGNQVGAASENSMKSFLALIRRRSFVLGSLACFLSIGAGQGFTTWIIVYFTKVHGFSLVAAGGILAASSIMSMVSPTASGLLSDLLKRRKPVSMIGGAGLFLTIVGLAVFTNTALLWAIMLAKGAIQSFLGIPLNVLQAESVAGPQAGSAMGFYNGVAQLGSVVFPLALGMVLDATNNNFFIVMMTIAITYALSATLISFMDEKRAIAIPKSVSA